MILIKVTEFDDNHEQYINVESIKRIVPQGPDKTYLSGCTNNGGLEVRENIKEVLGLIRLAYEVDIRDYCAREIHLNYRKDDEKTF
jgi:hypothetical protein